MSKDAVNMLGAMDMLGEMLLLEQRKKKLMEDYVMGLIQKFTPKIVELPEAERVQLVGASIKAWMISRDKKTIDCSYAGQWRTLLQLLGLDLIPQTAELRAALALLTGHLKQRGTGKRGMNLFDLLEGDDENSRRHD